MAAFDINVTYNDGEKSQALYVDGHYVKTFVENFLYFRSDEVGNVITIEAVK